MTSCAACHKSSRPSQRKTPSARSENQARAFKRTIFQPVFVKCIIPILLVIDLRFVHSDLARLKVEHCQVEVRVGVNELAFREGKGNACSAITEVDTESCIRIFCPAIEISLPNVMASDQESPLTRVDERVSSVINHLLRIRSESGRDEDWATERQHLFCERFHKRRHTLTMVVHHFQFCAI